MSDVTAFREALSGPIPTIRTPFTREGAVDEAALARMVEFDLDAGARAIVLTAGDSHYEALSDDAIEWLTRRVASLVAGRALVVAANRAFSSDHAVAFARRCREWGCDAVMVKPPDWAGSCTPASLAAHYAAVGRELPVMAVTNVFVARGEAFGLETLRQTRDATDAVVSVKDDMGGAFARRLALEFGDAWAVWAGGKKENHLNMAPYGAVGYLSAFLMCRPEIAWAYWRAWESRDLAEATRLIRDAEMPFFAAASAGRGGFDAGIHGALELYGLAARWRPAPYHTLSDDEMAALREALEENRLL